MASILSDVLFCVFLALTGGWFISVFCVFLKPTPRRQNIALMFAIVLVLFLIGTGLLVNVLTANKLQSMLMSERLAGEAQPI